MTIQNLVLYLFFAVVVVNATIDLYISKEEVQRILGFKGDLFYIRDGEENKNAIKYHLLIPENTDHIALTWQDKLYYAVSTTTYSAKVNASEDGILSSVTTSLSASGNVPSQEEAEFYINMTCKPNVKGSELVKFHLNMTIHTAEFGQSKYYLNFHFNKKCSDGSMSASLKPSDSEDDELDGKSGVRRDKINKTSMFYIAVGVTCSIILVIATAVAYLHIRSMPKNKEDLNQDADAINANETPKPPVKTADIPQALRMVRAEQQLKEMLINLKDFSVRRTLLTIGNTMQEARYSSI